MRAGVSPPAIAAELPTVLVVEDDGRVRELVRLTLEGAARVLEASDGDQALKMLEERGGYSLDLVLVDYVLPRPSGLEILRLTRDKWPWVPVVMMTAFGSEELAVQALRAGAKDYLQKPIDVRELRRAILTNVGGFRGSGDRDADSGTVSRSCSEEVGATHSGIHRALGFVREHFTEPITLAQVAGEAGLSKFHFCRLFQRQVGLSFRPYLRALRIDRAKVLLADRRLTVTEVAYASGFNDLSHFDKIFSKIVGVSPTAYRRACRSN